MCLSWSLLGSPLLAANAETYAWRNVAIGGGGFVTGVEFHPSTRDAGLWRSIDHAATWTRVGSFPELPDGSAGQPLFVDGRFNYLGQAVGIVWVRLAAARGQRGQPTPAIYAAISRSGESVFRSTDAGATWVRLTDAAHQFGSASRLTGDPRVFGRVYVCTGGRGIVYGERAE